jgi:hypothetical protein
VWLLHNSGEFRHFGEEEPTLMGRLDIADVGPLARATKHDVPAMLSAKCNQRRAFPKWGRRSHGSIAADHKLPLSFAGSEFDGYFRLTLDGY